MDKKNKNSSVANNSKQYSSDCNKALLSYINNSEKSKDPFSKAINTILLEERGMSREKRKEKILEHFSNNSSDDAKIIESILNKTMGLDNRQLESVLKFVQLKNFKDSKKFLNILDECIFKTWVDE